MSDLKACPFCGRKPDIEDCGEHRWFIRCKCGIAQDKLFFQKCDAVRAWNKRKELRVKDTISRQAAIDALKIAELGCDVEAIEALPSAESKESLDKIATRHEEIGYDKGFRDGYAQAVTDAEPVREPDEWCTDCKEYDHDKHCCHRFNRVIRSALQDAEIVRCRDCKWKNKHHCTRAVELFIHDNDFCSWAERRRG